MHFSSLLLSKVQGLLSRKKSDKFNKHHVCPFMDACGAKYSKEVLDELIVQAFHANFLESVSLNEKMALEE
jgi:hypothetical protein